MFVLSIILYRSHFPLVALVAGMTFTLHYSHATGLLGCLAGDLACKEKNAAYCTALGNAIMRKGSEKNPPDGDRIGEGAKLTTMGNQFLGQLVKTGYKMQFTANKFQLIDLDTISAAAESRECYKFYLDNLDDLNHFQREEFESKSR